MKLWDTPELHQRAPVVVYNLWLDDPALSLCFITLLLPRTFLLALLGELMMVVVGRLFCCGSMLEEERREDACNERKITNGIVIVSQQLE